MKYRDFLQKIIYVIITPVIKGMIRIGFTPNLVTTIGFVLNIAATIMLLYAAGEMTGSTSIVGWSGAVILFAGLFISHFVGLLCLIHNPLLSFIPPAPCPVHFPAVLVRAAVHKLCRALFLRLKIPFFKFLHRHGLPVKIPLGIPPAVL